jgi:hypothetical protein
MRRKTRRVLVVGVASMFVSVAHAASYDPTIEREQLQRALQQYTQCNQECAASLAGTIINSSVEEAVDLIAATKGLSTTTNKGMKAALVYGLFRRSYERAEKIVSSHGACSSQCDAMSADVVTLGRAGLLGPMVKGGKIDTAALESPEGLKVFLKYVKPIDPNKLPWQFHNEQWWKRIQNTA